MAAVWQGWFFPLGKSWAFLRNLRVGDEWGFIFSVFQGVFKAVGQMADETWRVVARSGQARVSGVHVREDLVDR
jgi:hypothetical protein